MIKEWTLTLQYDDCGHDARRQSFSSIDDWDWYKIIEYARSMHGMEGYCDICNTDRKVTGHTIDLSNIIYMDVVEWQEHNYPADTWLRYSDPSYIQRVRRELVTK